MIASLEDLNKSPEVISSAQDLIAVHHDTVVTVWNFVLDSIVTWGVLMKYEAVCYSSPVIIVVHH